jgi:hypothetical protein
MLAWAAEVHEAKARNFSVYLPPNALFGVSASSVTMCLQQAANQQQALGAAGQACRHYYHTRAQLQ